MFVHFDPKTQRGVLDASYVGKASILSTRLLLHTMHETRPFARGRLLDIGCGVKPYREFFGATQHIGIDWPNSKHKLDVQAYASAESIPFADNSFDTVLCTEVIEHLRHPALAVREMARVLKSDGHLILSAPFFHEMHEEPFDFFRFTLMGFGVLAEEAGLETLFIGERGGDGAVIANLWFRFLNRRLGGAMRRLPVLGGAMRALLLTWPQNLLAAVAEKKAPADALKKPSKTTLGYVLVARKP